MSPLHRRLPYLKCSDLDSAAAPHPALRHAANIFLSLQIVPGSAEILGLAPFLVMRQTQSVSNPLEDVHSFSFAQFH